MRTPSEKVLGSLILCGVMAAALLLLSVPSSPSADGPSGPSADGPSGPSADGFPIPSPVPSPANVQPRPTGVVVDTPSITIAGASATTTATPTSSAHEAQVLWNFGTVSGTYSGCTVQAQTAYDGVNFLTLGSGASVTVSSNTLNAWTIIEQLGTTSVTTSSVSSSTALGFGQLTRFNFSCSSYGTSAAVTVSVIYR